MGERGPILSIHTVLEDLGYGGRIVSLFMEMYCDTTRTVKLGGVETGEISVEVGLKQGCVLSPMLFSLYLQELGEELMASGDWVWIGSEGNERKIPGLFFADDMVLIADSERLTAPVEYSGEIWSALEIDI